MNITAVMCSLKLVPSTAGRDLRRGVPVKSLTPVGIALLGAIMVLLTSTSASAQVGKIWVRNHTDNWAWITARGYVSNWHGSSLENVAAWCVAPRSRERKTGFSHQIAELRVELTQGAQCAHPVVYDHTHGNLAALQSDTVEVHASIWDCFPRPKKCLRSEVYKEDWDPKPSPQPQPTPACPYDCQSWNPASRTCIGPHMNGCRR